MMLLTGASGVLGSAVRERGESSSIVALCHRRTIPGCALALAGDVTRPHLGLSRLDYASLCEQIDVVVHCAATVNMAAAESDYETINVSGTKHVARLAADAEAKLVHVSTAFVHGHDPTPRPSTYQASKRQAEDIVRAGRARGIIVKIGRAHV